MANSMPSPPASPPITAPATAPVWFITGCSTGFGRELAQQVLARGHQAVVTARDPARVADLAATGNALTLKLDVTDRKQVETAISAA